VQVTVANGDRVVSPGMSQGVALDIFGEQFKIDCHAILLDGFDIILGVQWLRTLGPILWDFKSLTMSFWHGSTHVTWRSINKTPGPLQLHAASTDDLLSALLDEFTDVFAKPRGLPPARGCDHRIHLLPGTAPIAVRPYRYPQLQKDEIERQCADMLEQGIIAKSNSAF
jgi:hypothetical protein